MLSSPAVFAIPGTASLAHLEENAGADKLALVDEDLRDLARDEFYGYRARSLARRALVRAGKAKAALKDRSR
jgi:aryl-alcohol dehydrogenase-like predicted oxidoreductase